MLIDWFTVVAQALNFLILVWLMKRFLYQPILDAIDAREELIAAELADAAAKEAEARKERDAFQRKNEAFDQQRAKLLQRAADEANLERQRLMDQARAAAADLNSKRQDALRSEARNLNQTIRRRTQHEVFAIARRALADLAAASLEQRMTEVFVRQLRALDGQARVSLSEALAAASDSVLVRSAFDLPEEQRASIQRAINETFSADIQLRFETAPSLVSGIELSAGGQEVAWSIDGYLASLEKEVAELLGQKASAGTSDDGNGASLAVATGT